MQTDLTQKAHDTINELEKIFNSLEVVDPNDAVKQKQLIYELRNLMAVRYAKSMFPDRYFNTDIA